MSDGREMAEFWDARAGEDPFYFIWNNGRYRHPDPALFWASGEADLDAVCEQLAYSIPADAHVVELGCGAGRMTRALATRAARVSAVDVSARMLELAREHNPDLENVEWLQGSGTDLSVVEDRSADLVFSHVVLQHIPDPAVISGYIAEMGRVLRDGGEAVFGLSTDPAIHRPAITRGVGRALGALRVRLGRAPRGQNAPQWLGAALDPDDLAVALGRAGLDSVKIAGLGTQFTFVHARRAS